MKTNPAVGYDYVLGDKGTSEPIENKKHTQLVNNAKDFNAETGVNGRVNIYDHNGNHIMHFEHRSAHGAFLSNQVNGKYGTGKPKKPTSAEKDVAKQRVKTVKDSVPKPPRVPKSATEPTPKPPKPPKPAKPMVAPDRMTIGNHADVIKKVAKQRMKKV